MALWQYMFHVLPKEAVQNTSTDFNFINDEEGFDDAPFWENLQIECSFFENISKILPRGKSWSEMRILYGNQESNCFEVLFENNMVVSVSFRIDFTSKYELILNELIEFFILNGLIILDENLNILPLNIEIIEGVIKNSPQFKKYDELSNHSL